VIGLTPGAGIQPPSAGIQPRAVRCPITRISTGSAMSPAAQTPIPAMNRSKDIWMPARVR
jgi:hypothetical protein